MTSSREELQAPPGAVFDRSTEGSVERNLEPILNALSPYFQRQQTQRVLELASGLGQHIASWATQHPSVTFQPTDRDPESVQFASTRVSDLPNVRQPRIFDLLDDQAWPTLCESADSNEEHAKFDMLVSINLIHVSPWPVTEALFKHVNEVLSETTGILAFYGAFKIGGTCEESNEAFDKTLRERDPRFGLRDMEKIEQLAACADLRVLARRQMPSNNWMLVLGRTNQPPL